MHSSPENAPPYLASSIPSRPVTAWALAGVTACFLLSGFAALLYQTAWTRQFSLIFGTSELAVATVLAAYMGGLALGARVVESYLHRVRQPVLVYGVLEFGIGLAAVTIPLLLVGAERLMVLTLGNQPSPPEGTGWLQTSFYVVTAFAVLVVPTALMGATLPLLARHAVQTQDQIGRRIGLLYAANTLGAVGGAVIAAFALLPGVGLQETVVTGAVINVFVFCIAALIARSQSRGTAPPRAWGDGTRPPRLAWKERLAPGPSWILPIMLASGAASFTYEVLWTRMLSHVLGGSLYAFAVMVASFLLGIALGSAVAAVVARTRQSSQIAFIISQVAIAACSIGVYLSLDSLVPAQAGLRGNVSLALLVLLPPAIFIGATFPLAVRIHANEATFAAASAARVYAWNTVGAIVGSLLAGFVVIPALRFEGTIHLAVLVNITLALAAALLFAKPRLVWGAGLAASVAATAFFFQPAIPQRLLSTSPLNVTSDGELRFYEVGRSASVVVLEHGGELLLRTNGLPEAVIDLAGAVPKFSGEFWLSPLAVIARPDTRSMLVVGYGGGSVIDGVPPTVRDVDVIELEPEVLAANNAVRELRARDPSLDPRVHVILNDARGSLSLTSRTYDAIVSQPSHPWTAGASHLYTREFMSAARRHLAPGGVFVQWMNVDFLDEDLLRSLSATLLDVFAHVRIYRPDPNTFVFLASDQPLDIEQTVAQTGRPLSEYPRHYARFGIHTHEDLLAALAADRDGVVALARGAPLVTDDRNRMATAGAYDRGIGLDAATASRVLAQYDPLQRNGSWVFAPGFPMSVSYLARRIQIFGPVDAGVPARLRRIARLVGDPSMAAYVAGVSLRNEPDPRVAQRYLSEALALDPRNEAARYDLLRPWLGALAQGKAPAEIVEIAKGLPETAATLIQVGKYAVASDWAHIPPLDKTLKATNWTDAWHLDSVQARAEWRSRVATPQLRAKMGREALAILDEAIVSQPTTTMYTLRAHAAESADQPDVVLESLSGFVRSAKAIPSVQARDRAQLRASFDALLQMLDAIGKDERVRDARRTAVRASILEAKAQLVETAAR